MAGDAMRTVYRCGVCGRRGYVMQAQRQQVRQVQCCDRRACEKRSIRRMCYLHVLTTYGMISA